MAAAFHHIQFDLFWCQISRTVALIVSIYSQSHVTCLPPSLIWSDSGPHPHISCLWAASSCKTLWKESAWVDEWVQLIFDCDGCWRHADSCGKLSCVLLLAAAVCLFIEQTVTCGRTTHSLSINPQTRFLQTWHHLWQIHFPQDLMIN